jgi:hypothetical protein
MIWSGTSRPWDAWSYGPWFLVVHTSVPARNVKELIALARAAPGRLNYATSGTGSSAHLANELFNSIAKVSMVHIPYKGTSEGVVAVATGQADMIFASIPAATPLLSAGRVRALAVTTGKRTSLAPEMPTLIESGMPGYDRSGWYGMLAPAAVPREIVVRLNAIIVKAMNTPDLQDAFRRQGLDPAPTTPEGIRRVHQERNRAEHQGGEGSRDQSGMRARSRLVAWLQEQLGRPRVPAVDLDQRFQLLDERHVGRHIGQLSSGDQVKPVPSSAPRISPSVISGCC